MNIVVDMNLCADWTGFLGGAGHTAVHWADEGAPNASDRELLQWAAERNYVVLAADLDTAAVAAASLEAKPSVILAPLRLLTPEALGSAVLGAIHQAKTALGQGAIVTIAAEEGTPAHVHPFTAL
jgi:predicted nuclease of predicted toxin-antitoxin system